MAETAAEVSIPQDLLERILASVTPNAVLVGGQSLAFWVAHYGIELPARFQIGAISDDADFLSGREDIKAIARQMGGIPEFMSRRSLSALVGQVQIPLSPAEFVNVDVLHRLVGPPAQAVRERASAVKVGRSGAGRKVSREFGIDFRSAIPGYAIASESFHKYRYPQILLELQPPA